ncbi:MAG: COX15/CtaA family protein [Bdellovibrionales bacterium]|nr:COX15/CtaA family protein [Bdellovibrionales bacterium]
MEGADPEKRVSLIFDMRFLTIERFRVFSHLNLAFTLLVIVWGAYVRATGSGAGCGDHWPLCNGEVIPRPERSQTVIEFAHRASSGVSLLLVIFGYFWARRISEAGSWIRRISLLGVFAILLEAALGAGLVLLKLVEFDQSVARAISIALHLVNTLFLIATLSSLCWLTTAPGMFGRSRDRIFPRERQFWIAFAVFLLLGMSGAIAALGDTLFPSENLLSGVMEDFRSGSHFLLRLRVIHPVLAVLWLMLAFFWSNRLEEMPGLSSYRNLLLGGVVIQFLIGFLNWILMAPNWLQLVHLFFADLVFIAFFLSGLAYEARKSRIKT